MAKNFFRSLGLVGAIAFIPAATAGSPRSKPDSVREIDQFMSVFERVKAEYVDQVTDEQLIRGAIDGMLNSLDPHTSYLDARGFRTLMTTTDGNYGGLGLTVTMEDGAVKVIAATRGTPADRAGIKAGDFITHIDGRLFYGGTLDEAVDRMRGNPGTSVRLTIVRPGRERPFDVTITRAIIDIPAVRSEVARPRRHHHRHHLQPGHHRRRDAARHRRISSASSAARRSAMCSTCAPIRAACSIRRSAFPTCSSSAARSSRSAAAAAPTSSVIMPGPATSTQGVPIIVLVDAGSASASEIVAGGAAGSSPRDRHGRAHLRQGLGPDPAAARRRQHRAAPHHGALLHAVGPLGAGGRDHAGRARAAALRSRLPAAATGSANPICAAISSTRPACATSSSRTTAGPIRASPLTAEQLTAARHHRLPARLCDPDAGPARPGPAAARRRRAARAPPRAADGPPR